MVWNGAAKEKCRNKPSLYSCLSGHYEFNWIMQFTMKVSNNIPAYIQNLLLF